MPNTLYEYFEEKALKYPELIACVCGDERLSYKELNYKVGQLGQYLRAEGFKPEQVVGLLFNRSLDIVISLLAVMKVGSAFMIIDPAYPIERIHHMLINSQVKLVLSNSESIQGFPFSEIQGFEQNTFEILCTEKRPQLDFNLLPLPDRSLINFEVYSRYCKMSLSRKVVTIQATRGCPYKCIYCHNVWPKTHSRRSSDNIFSEILQCYKAGIRKFSILDDIFNLDMKDSLRVFQLIITHKLDVEIYFPNGLRGDILNKEYIDIMVEAGLVHLALSLETASERLQKLIGKNLIIDKFRENIEYISSQYPQVILDLFTMHGFPTETEDEAMETLKFIESIKWIHFPYVFVLKIFPNSPIYDFAIQNGVSKEAIEKSIKYAYHEISDTLPFPKEFSIMYQSRIFNEYILNKERLLKVLPYQMSLLTETEFLNQYDIYFPQGIKSRDDLLKTLNINSEEIADMDFRPDDTDLAIRFSENIKTFSPLEIKKEKAFRIILLDVSQLFINDSQRHNNLNEEPLGLMYLLTYLNKEFKENVIGKIIKPVIDYNSYEDLKYILDEFQPDLIGIRSLSVYKDFFHQTVAHIRFWGITVPIITGGPYATSSYKTLLQDRNIDIAVIGEGEETFKQLILKIIEYKGQLPPTEILKDINGIAFVKVAGISVDSKTKGLFLLDQIDFKNADFLPAVSNKGSDLCYVTYTSGTTGLPKGIMIEHEGLVKLLENWIKEYSLIETEVKILQIAAFSFDVFVGDLLKSIMTGGSLIIADETERKDMETIAGLICQEKISHIESTPDFIGLIINYIFQMDLYKDSLQMLIIGGESASILQYRDLLHKTQGKVRVINGYGVSECTIESCFYEANFIDFFKKGNCPIGKAFKDVEVYILKENFSITAIGEEGELYIGGSSLFRGYINSPDDDKKAFIKNPFGNGRLYRTGDLVVKQADRNIMYLGRKDYQIKIRGYRIEPIEIETVLMQLSGVFKCLVIGWEGKIVAYYSSKETIGSATMIQHIKRILPEYMVPAYFIHLNDFPMSSNGKIERRSLPVPSNNNFTEQESTETETEIFLKDLWKKVLNLDTFSIHDSFFDLGGDSLDCVRIITEINLRGFQLKVTDVYNHRTIHSLASYLEEKNLIPVQSANIFSKIEEKISQVFNIEVVYQQIHSKITEISFKILLIKELEKHHIINKYIKENYSFDLQPNYIFESKQGEDNFFVSSPNHEAVSDMLKNLRKQEIEYSNQILSSSVLAEYTNSSYHESFRAIFRQVYFFEQIIFDQNVDVVQLSTIIKQVYKVQSILCSIIVKKKKQFYFREYSVPQNLTIPFLDLSTYSPNFNYNFITEVLKKYYQKQDKLRVFPFRILLIKFDLKQYYLGFLMDEAIHDKVSVDIFKQAIISSLKGNFSHFVEPYRHYISSINNGPIGLNADDVVKTFQLKRFEKFTHQLKQSFQWDKPKIPSMFMMRYKLNSLAFYNNQWDKSLELFIVFCQKILMVDNIPMVVVHDTRAYDNFVYKNTIGEFMDFVPVVIDAKKMSPAEISNNVRNNMEIAVQNNINFINMYHRPDYPKNYKKIHKLAVSSVGPISKSETLLIFHYRTEIDSSIELRAIESIIPSINPWLKGVYFGIRFLNNELILNLNLPFKINKKELELFLKTEIERRS